MFEAGYIPCSRFIQWWVRMDRPEPGKHRFTRKKPSMASTVFLLIAVEFAAGPIFSSIETASVGRSMCGSPLPWNRPPRRGRMRSDPPEAPSLFAVTPLCY